MHLTLRNLSFSRMANELCPSRLTRTCRSALDVLDTGIQATAVDPTVSAVISSFSVGVVVVVVVMMVMMTMVMVMMVMMIMMVMMMVMMMMMMVGMMMMMVMMVVMMMLMLMLMMTLIMMMMMMMTMMMFSHSHTFQKSNPWLQPRAENISMETEKKLLRKEFRCYLRMLENSRNLNAENNLNGGKK